MNFQTLISLCQPATTMGKNPIKVGSLVTDSRKVKKGDVFIALRGHHSDGHQYISDVVSNGAAVVIVEEFDPDLTISQIKVDDTRLILGRLAQEFEGNPASKLQVAGVTGTNGKTTVATLVHQVLRKLNHPAVLLGTVATIINDTVQPSRLTTPDPLELAGIFKKAVNAGSKLACMEVSSHALDQYRVSGLNFAVAGFTNLSHDHLDYHKDVNSYAKAKKKLFDTLTEDAIAIINTDDPHGDYMVNDCRAEVIRYGFHNNQGDKILQCDSEGIEIQVQVAKIKSPLIGEFNAYNLALAYHICKALGCAKADIADALSDAPGAPGRMEKLVVESNTSLPVVLIDYAHTPDALKNVLKTLCEVRDADQSIHVVFGAGGDRDAAKRPVMARFAEEYADTITVTSDNPRSENPDAIIDDIFKGFSSIENVIRVVDRKAAIVNTIHGADSNSIILIAGKGHETYQEVHGVYHHFDDKAIASEALREYETQSYTERRVN